MIAAELSLSKLSLRLLKEGTKGTWLGPEPQMFAGSSIDAVGKKKGHFSCYLQQLRDSCLMPEEPI